MAKSRSDKPSSSDKASRGDKPSRSNKSFQFEEALARLEQLVDAMESGELSLEDSLKAFEEGITLTRDCQKALDQAEQSVQVLMEKHEGFTLTDLDDTDNDQE